MVACELINAIEGDLYEAGWHCLTICSFVGEMPMAKTTSLAFVLTVGMARGVVQ